MGGLVRTKRPEPPSPESEKPPWVPHKTVNLDHVDYVATTARGVVIVAKRGGRVYSINVPEAEIQNLAARLRFPIRKAKGRA
jgi:hypothetical protein